MSCNVCVVRCMSYDVLQNYVVPCYYYCRAMYVLWTWQVCRDNCVGLSYVKKVCRAMYVVICIPRYACLDGSFQLSYYVCRAVYVLWCMSCSVCHCMYVLMWSHLLSCHTCLGMYVLSTMSYYVRHYMYALPKLKSIVRCMSFLVSYHVYRAMYIVRTKVKLHHFPKNCLVTCIFKVGII